MGCVEVTICGSLELSPCDEQAGDRKERMRPGSPAASPLAAAVRCCPSQSKPLPESNLRTTKAGCKAKRLHDRPQAARFRVQGSCPPGRRVRRFHRCHDKPSAAVRWGAEMLFETRARVSHPNRQCREGLRATTKTGAGRQKKRQGNESACSACTPPPTTTEKNSTNKPHETKAAVFLLES